MSTKHGAGREPQYRARDTKLDRNVALKVLPPAVTQELNVKSESGFVEPSQIGGAHVLPGLGSRARLR